jgi:hypothetical protein
MNESHDASRNQSLQKQPGQDVESNDQQQGQRRNDQHEQGQRDTQRQHDADQDVERGQQYQSSGKQRQQSSPSDTSKDNAMDRKAQGSDNAELDLDDDESQRTGRNVR